MESPLHYFLNPQSVAMIGVSPNWSFVNTILKQFLALKTPARVYPVNPNYPEVEGLKSYPWLTDIPDPVDLVIVSVPARLVPDAMQQCAEKQVKAINIITSGFAEIGGEEGQRRHRMMTDFVQRTGIRIVGPNCFGNMSSPHRFAGMPRTDVAVTRPGGLSLAFQSGGLAIYMVTACVDRYIGLAHVVSSGNEADIEMGDCVRFFAEDDHTKVIGCYVEQFRDPQKFLEAAELCAERRKPIVVLKVGRSEAGRRMAQAHTGSLAGSDEVIDAVLRKYGITRVYDLNEMLEAMAILHSRKLPKGKGVAVLTASGGANAVLTDLGEDIGVEFPPFAEEGWKKVRSALYDYITVSNPLDITGPGGVTDQHVHQAALEAMGADPNMHTILHLLGGNTKLDAQSPAGKVLLSTIQKYPEKVWVRMSAYAGTFHEKPPGPDLIEPITEIEGIPFLQGMGNSLRAVVALIRYAEFQRKRAGQRSHPPTAPALHPQVAGQAREIVQAAHGQALTETAGKQILNLYGIPTTREALATTAEEAVHLAQEIGFPVAMKIVSPHIMHKTEAGGVLLQVQSAEEVRTGFTRILENARRYNAQAQLDGVSIQEMVSGGHEMIIGMIRDPQFGPGVLLGLGGIFVEILKDVVIRVPPLSPEDAQEMIESLKGKAILTGARGGKPADLQTLIEVLQKFSSLCLDLQEEVSEIDINPLMVLEEGKGVKALDCLIVPQPGKKP